MKVTDFIIKKISGLLDASDNEKLEAHFLQGTLGDHFENIEPEEQQELNELNVAAMKFEKSAQEVFAVFNLMQDRKNATEKEVITDLNDETKPIKQFFKERAQQVDEYSNRLSIHIAVLAENHKAFVGIFEFIVKLLFDKFNTKELRRIDILSVNEVKEQLELKHQKLVETKEWFASAREAPLERLANPEFNKKVVYTRSVKRYLKLIDQLVDIYSEIEFDLGLLNEFYTKRSREIGIE